MQCHLYNVLSISFAVDWLYNEVTFETTELIWFGLPTKSR